MLTVKTMDSLQSAPGDFGAAINPFRKELYLPRDVINAGWPGLHDGVDGLWFFAHASSFPSSLAQGLGWKPEEVTAAAQKLGEELIREGFIKPETLNPPQRRGLGANEAAAKTTGPQPGDRMADGTKVAGISPDTDTLLFAMGEDATLTQNFAQAQSYAEKVNARGFGGYNDWRVPTPGELRVMYNNRAAIGGFDESITSAAAWYWTSKECGKDTAQGLHMATGSDFTTGKGGLASVRLVRG